jgi:hypothetical protein
MVDQLPLYPSNSVHQLNPGPLDDPSNPSGDLGLLKVKAALEKKKNFQEIVSGAIREAIDTVIDGQKTLRWKISDLEKTEKTYIGTRVEIELKWRLALQKGKELDIGVEGEEVDIKFSLNKQWMIPTEAVGKLCLVVSADDDKSEFAIGIVRANKSNLGKGENKDKKKSLSKEGREKIQWLVEKGQLKENFLLHLDPKILAKVMDQKTPGIPDKQKGQQRVNDLLRLVKNKPIPREAIVTVAQQRDPMKRVRDAKKQLLKEGITVACGRYKDQQKIAKDRGFEITRDEVISFNSGQKDFESMTNSSRNPNLVPRRVNPA